MSELIKLDVDYIYNKIPGKYVFTYQTILGLLAEYAEDMLKDCKASCKDRNNNIIDCFNLFNGALAAYNLNNEKLADTVIKYIDAKLNQINAHVPDSGLVIDIDNGHIKILANKSSQNVEFYIDENDLHLYEKYIENLEDNIELENGHLINYGRDN